MTSTLTFRPLVFAGLCLSALVALGVPVLLAVLARKKLGAPWKALGVGAATFIISQPVLRLPWQIALGLHWKDVFARSASLALAWLACSAFTAALFEETGRLVAMRRFLKAEPSYRVGLMFGIGHGGIESILLVGLSIAVSAALYLVLALGLPLPLPTEAHDALVKQFLPLTPAMTLMGGAERLAAIALHIAQSLMVMRAVAEKNLRWYALAFAYHAVGDFVGPEAVRLWGIYWGELVIAGVAAPALWFIVREGRRADQGPRLPRIT